jgi:hypothetical protein
MLKGTEVVFEKAFFTAKPDSRTYDNSIPKSWTYITGKYEVLKLYSNFQLSRCTNVEIIGNRRTDERTGTDRFSKKLN